MKHSLKLFIPYFFIFSTLKIHSQLSGSYNVPGTFTSIAVAINSLNTAGVSGAVTINIAAGYTETTPVGGFQLNTITGASAANTIIFMKSGSGANPLISAYIGGTATPAFSTQHDGIWKFFGSDYVTIDGIDLLDPNSSNPSTMEYGYGFFKASNINGCQNNTIKNCVITLNRINGALGSGVSQNGSKGIYVSCSTISTPLQSVNTITNTTASGPNSYNKFYANKVQNCHMGIVLVGLNNGFTPTTDQQNDVGGLSAATGNTIVNFGGGTGSFAGAIYSAAQYTFNASFNTINNNDGSGADPQAGVFVLAATSFYPTKFSANNNTITLSCMLSVANGIGGISYLVSNQSFNTPQTVDVNNNVFTSVNHPNSLGGTSADFITCGVQDAYCNIMNNLIQNLSFGSVSLEGIECQSTGTSNISSNTITAISANTGNSMRMILGNNSIVQNISNNYISNIAYNSTTANNIYCIESHGTTSLNISGNTLTNVRGNVMYGIQIGQGTSVTTINGNSIFDFGSAPSSTQGTSFAGISILGGSVGSTLDINTNKIYSASSTCLTNTVSGFMLGISVSANVNQCNIFGNKIYSLATDKQTNVFGVYFYGLSCDIYNNLIGDLSVSNYSLMIAGVYLDKGTVNMHFNTINLSPVVNSGTNIASTAVYNYSTATTNLRNNILVNTYTASGTCSATVLHRSATTLSNYGSLSNRNLMYAGTPAPDRLILRNATNNYSTIASFKSLVSPLEAQTFTEVPPFITTNGAMPNWLNINPTILTQIEGWATPISGVTIDYGGNARHPSMPDVGAWEGNFLQIDNFAPVILSKGLTAPPCNNFSTATFTMSVKDTTGVASGTLSPRLYYKVNAGSYSSTQGVLASGTPSNGVWTFTLTYSASLGSVISYFIAIQDVSTQNNLLISPSTGASANSVNSIITYPTQVYSYTIETNPSISAGSGSICPGGTFQIVATGATSYSYTGGSATVNPVNTTTYNVVGYSSNGCPSSNTPVVTVTVMPTPTLSINNGSLCLGQSFTLSPGGAATYTFSSGLPIVSPSQNTTYTITGTSSGGCISAPVIVTLSVNLSQITAQASSSAICKGSQVTFNGGGGSNYTWTGGVQDNVAFYPNATTSYTVSGISNNSCPGSATVHVTVNALPVLTLGASDQTICTGQSVILNVTGAGSYTWQPGGISSTQATVMPVITTDYTVTGVDIKGCASSSVITINISDCLGINDVEARENILVYPNPAKEKIIIDLKTNSQQLTVKIHNALSQLIYDSVLQNKTIVDLTGHAKGIYFVRIYNNAKLLKEDKIVLE